jgi:hypothetical protein
MMMIAVMIARVIVVIVVAIGAGIAHHTDERNRAFFDHLEAQPHHLIERQARDLGEHLHLGAPRIGREPARGLGGLRR